MPVPITAITAALEIAAAIATHPETLDKAADLADSATKAINAGAKTAGAAAEAMGPVAKKAAGASAEMGSKAADAAGKAVGDVSKKVGGVFTGASNKMKEAKEAQQREKALQDARRKVLDGASAMLDAPDFERNWESASTEGLSTPLKSPGYYVIATYKSKPNKDGAATYTGIYVGRSENMGASVHRHLSGGGNPDVYADMKYGKCVRVYAFPDFDDTDDNNETLQGFCTALGADASYNARVSSEAEKATASLTVVMPHAQESKMLDALASQFPNMAIEELELCGAGMLTCRARIES